MALEIVGSRILAPYFGSSVYVWGSLISIFLAALSAGYYLGGVAADRWPRAGTLALALAVAGALLLMLARVSRPIVETFSACVLAPRATPRVAPRAVSVMPRPAPAMTAPAAIRPAATDLASVRN